MISSDILNQLQLLIKTVAPPLIEVAKTPLEKVQLLPGEHVQVTVLTSLPNGRFQVAIGEQVLDMNLPKNTQAGEKVDLTFVTNQPRLTFVLSRDIPLPPAATAATGDKASVAISDSARYLGALLNKIAITAEGQTAPLAKAAPLLASVPTNPVEMAQAMQKALSKSGLFYESHQAQWVAGERPLTELLQEPQAQLSRPSLLAMQASLEQTAKSATPQPADIRVVATPTQAAPSQANPGPTPPGLVTLNQAASSLAASTSVPSGPALPNQATPNQSAPNQATANQAALYQATSNQSAPYQAIPNHGAPSLTPLVQSAQPQEGRTLSDNAPLPGIVTGGNEAVHPKAAPLVQQQLNTLDTHQLVWQGQVWPNQAMEWHIEERPDSAPGSVEASEWQTSLRLYLPNLGEVSAGIRLTRQGIHIRLNTPRESSVAMMQQRQSELVSGLSAAGLNLVELAVEHTDGKA